MSVRTHRPPALTFGPYQLVERLSGPSITERHRALGPDGAFVVLHVLRPEITRDFAVRALFQVHAAKAKSLDHASIAKIVDSGESDGRLFLAVREVAGQELSLWLSALRDLRERPDTTTVRAIVRDVASALTHAHARGVIHGDVRPGNVIVRPSGGAALTGFVIARSLRTDTQERIAVAGFAPPYMAPEQANGKGPDERTDLYALGVLTYELLTGRTPYAGETPLAVLLAHGREPLPLPSQIDPLIPGPLERFLLRALAVDPAARHADPRAFSEALDEAFEEASARAVPMPIPATVPAAPAAARVRATSPRSRALIGGTAVLAAGVVLGLLIPRPTTVATAPAPTAAPPSAAPAPTAPPPPPTLPPVVVVQPTILPPVTVPRGALLYQAKLDGSAELDGIRVFSGGEGDAAIRATRGAFELEVVHARGGAEAFFPVPARASYAVEFTIAAAPGSEALLSWALRRDGDAAYLLRLDAAAETLSLVYDDGVRLREALAPQARVSGFRTGRPLALQVSLNGADLLVVADGRVALQARDLRIARSTLAPDVFVGDEGGVGLVRITAARFFALP